METFKIWVRNLIIKIEKFGLPKGYKGYPIQNIKDYLKEDNTMGRQQAIKWMKDIQSGSGVDRRSFPDSMKGSIVKEKWHDSIFIIGIEYGVLIAIMKIFNLKEEDLKKDETVPIQENVEMANKYSLRSGFDRRVTLCRDCVSKSKPILSLIDDISVSFGPEEEKCALCGKERS